MMIKVGILPGLLSLLQIFPMYAHVQGILGSISETDSAGWPTSYLVAPRPAGCRTNQPNNLLRKACGRL